MRVLPYGDAALLVELEDVAQVTALAAALRARPHPGVLDIVPGARTVLVRVDPAFGSLEAARAAVGSADLTRRVALDERLPPLVLPVVYDGADLAEVGELTGLGARGVVEAHTAALWTVAFCGFAPGFAYCVSGDDRLHVPRRTAPRTAVPAGSVALGGEFTGVYPRESPGGWQLVGRTNDAVWDPRRERPALLAPGMQVRFVEADE